MDRQDNGPAASYHRLQSRIQGYTVSQRYRPTPRLDLNEDVCIELFNQLVPKPLIWLRLQELHGRVKEVEGVWEATEKWDARFKDPIRSRLDTLRALYKKSQTEGGMDEAWKGWEEVPRQIRAPVIADSQLPERIRRAAAGPLPVTRTPPPAPAPSKRKRLPPTPEPETSEAESEPEPKRGARSEIPTTLTGIPGRSMAPLVPPRSVKREEASPPPRRPSAASAPQQDIKPHLAPSASTPVGRAVHRVKMSSSVDMSAGRTSQQPIVVADSSEVDMSSASDDSGSDSDDDKSIGATAHPHSGRYSCRSICSVESSGDSLEGEGIDSDSSGESMPDSNLGEQASMYGAREQQHVDGARPAGTNRVPALDDIASGSSSADSQRSSSPVPHPAAPARKPKRPRGQEKTPKRQCRKALQALRSLRRRIVYAPELQEAMISEVRVNHARFSEQQRAYRILVKHGMLATNGFTSQLSHNMAVKLPDCSDVCQSRAEKAYRSRIAALRRIILASSGIIVKGDRWPPSRGERYELPPLSSLDLTENRYTTVAQLIRIHDQRFIEKYGDSSVAAVVAAGLPIGMPSEVD